MPMLITWITIALLGLIAAAMLRAGWREIHGEAGGTDALSEGPGAAAAGSEGAGSFLAASGRTATTARGAGDRPPGTGQPLTEDLDEERVIEVLLALEMAALLPEQGEVTRFGEPVEDPRWSARVLRALASRHGLGVHPVEAVDERSLVAAVIAADALMLVTGAERLEEVGAHSTGAARTFARVLFRAAGGDVRSAPRMHLPGPAGGLPERDEQEVARYTEWAIRLAGSEQAAYVLRAAAEDLSQDTSGGRFVELAELLEEAADELAVIGRS